MMAMRPKRLLFASTFAGFTVLNRICPSCQLHERRGDNCETRTTELSRLRTKEQLHAGAAADNSRHSTADLRRADRPQGYSHHRQDCGMSTTEGSGAGGVLQGARWLRRRRPCQLRGDRRQG